MLDTLDFGVKLLRIVGVECLIGFLGLFFDLFQRVVGIAGRIILTGLLFRFLLATFFCLGVLGLPLVVCNRNLFS